MENYGVSDSQQNHLYTLAVLWLQPGCCHPLSTVHLVSAGASKVMQMVQGCLIALLHSVALYKEPIPACDRDATQPYCSKPKISHIFVNTSASVGRRMLRCPHWWLNLALDLTRFSERLILSERHQPHEYQWAQSHANNNVNTCYDLL